jgi:hypothetical protein
MRRVVAFVLRVYFTVDVTSFVSTVHFGFFLNNTAVRIGILLAKMREFISPLM